MDNIYQFFVLIQRTIVTNVTNVTNVTIYFFSLCSLVHFLPVRFMLSISSFRLKNGIKKFLRNFAPKNPPKNVKTQRQNKTMFDRFCIPQQNHLKL